MLCSVKQSDDVTTAESNPVGFRFAIPIGFDVQDIALCRYYCGDSDTNKPYERVAFLPRDAMLARY